MSLSRWKELAQRKTKAGKAVNQLYDGITKEKIKLLLKLLGWTDLTDWIR